MAANGLIQFAQRMYRDCFGFGVSVCMGEGGMEDNMDRYLRNYKLENTVEIVTVVDLCNFFLIILWIYLTFK